MKSGFHLCVLKSNSRQSIWWTHIHQTSRTTLNNRCLPARKLMAPVFWETKGELTVDIMQERATITSESVSRNTKKNMQCHSEEKSWNADIQCTLSAGVRLQMFSLDRCWNNSIGNCLTILRALISSRATSACLSTWIVVKITALHGDEGPSRWWRCLLSSNSVGTKWASVLTLWLMVRKSRALASEVPYIIPRLWSSLYIPVQIGCDVHTTTGSDNLVMNSSRDKRSECWQRAKGFGAEYGYREEGRRLECPCSNYHMASVDHWFIISWKVCSWIQQGHEENNED
jgi:hypothetical protein